LQSIIFGLMVNKLLMVARFYQAQDIKFCKEVLIEGLTIFMLISYGLYVGCWFWVVVLGLCGLLVLSYVLYGC